MAASFAGVLFLTVLLPTSASGQSDDDSSDALTAVGSIILGDSALAGAEAETGDGAATASEAPSITAEASTSDTGSITEVAPATDEPTAPIETAPAPMDAASDTDDSATDEPATAEPGDEADDDQSATASDDTSTDSETDSDAAASDTAATDTSAEDTLVDTDEDLPTGSDASDATSDDEETDEESEEPAAQENEAGVADDGVITPPDVVFPVVGPVNYVDTWGACRGVGCSRGHKGVDIFGAKLAPMVAASDGVITADRRSGLGISGNMVILTSDDGWRYLYIHVNNDTPGTDDGANPQGWIIPNRLRVGSRVKAGDVIGYLGDSGNAETTPAHVHFEIHEPGVGAVNPTPYVQAAQEAGRVVSTGSLASTAEGRAEYGPVVSAWYRALLKREPTDIELFAWTDRFDIDFATLDDLIADLTMTKARRDPAGAVVRSFEVALNRRPTINELRSWEQEYRSGKSLDDITGALIASGPFSSVNGDLTDEEFVRVIYNNAIGVDPSSERLADWVTSFDDGEPRSSLTAYWADSYSVKNSTWHGLEVIQAFRAALDRLPNDDEYDLWVDHLNDGGLIPDIVANIRQDQE